MKPVVTVEEMRSIDAASPVAEMELIHRAGWAVSRAAIRMMGGTYGRRVVLIAGPGNNGADARKAAEFLAARGVRCKTFAPGELVVVPGCDLVIDGAYGTGFRGEYTAPDPNGAPVLAIDIPTGVNGNTGVAVQGSVRADVTVTFAALKPGHLLHDGPDHVGALELVDIGLDTSVATMHLFEDGDLEWALPLAKRDSHKWKTAVGVVAGSPGMMGAARLVVTGAQRAGAGMVRLLSPGVGATDGLATEAVVMDGTSDNWVKTIDAIAHRLHAVAAGPGLGRSDIVRERMRELTRADSTPLVLDADGLMVLGDEEGRSALMDRQKPVVLTPHDGEFEALAGSASGDDRVGAVRSLAARTNSVVLLKGSTTVVAAPDSTVYFSTAGDVRLATAGTGDVLTGVVAAFVAQGVEPALAAVAAANVHGRAAKNSYSRGLIASDLPENVAKLVSTQ